MFEELNKRRQAVADNIAKSFENDIEKALGAGYDPEGSDGDNVEKQAELFSNISSLIKKYDISEDEYNEISKQYQAYDMPYTDFAPHEMLVPIAKNKIRTELNKFDEFSDDDWMTGDKQTEIEDKLRFYVRHYNIDEKEWNEIVKPYAEGLSGLPYEDFK